MQTIAANLGSMLTPIGNPQNLYEAKKGSSVTDEGPGRTPFGFIVCLSLIHI